MIDPEDFVPIFIRPCNKLKEGTSDYLSRRKFDGDTFKSSFAELLCLEKYLAKTFSCGNISEIYRVAANLLKISSRPFAKNISREDFHIFALLYF